MPTLNGPFVGYQWISGTQPAAHIGQSKYPQTGKLGEHRPLERGDLLVVQLGHVVIRERTAGDVVDLEAGVELQHVQEL